MSLKTLAYLAVALTSATSRAYQDLANDSWPAEVMMDGNNSSDIFVTYSAVIEETVFRNLSGSVCTDMYSCSSPDRKPNSLDGCSCHDGCHLFGDCCWDKQRPSDYVSTTPLPRDAYFCHSVNTNVGSIHVIKKCPETYWDKAVAERCAVPMNIGTAQADDVSTPVTAEATGLSYRNIYCAICWNVAVQSVAPWLWNYYCFEYDNQASTNGTDTTASDYIRSNCMLTYLPRSGSLPGIKRCVPNLIDSCQDGAKLNSSLWQTCSGGLNQYVYSNSFSVYRNMHCAACDYNPPKQSELSCGSRTPGGGMPQLSFSILLTPGTGFCAASYGDLGTVTALTPEKLCEGIADCSDSNSQSPICFFSICPFGRLSAGRRCQPPNATYSCDFSDDVSAGLSSQWQSAYFENETLVLQRNDTSALCYICNVQRFEYFALSNGTISVNASGFNDHAYSWPFYSLGNGAATVCVSLKNISAVSRISPYGFGCEIVSQYVTVALLVVSEASLSIFFVAYATTKFLRRFPGEMILNESIAFFLGFMLFLTRPLAGESPAACLALALLVHYFLVAAFVWTALYSVEVARALSFRVGAGGGPRRRRAAYYSVGWGVPLAIVIVGVAADEVRLPFRPAYGVPQCFIGNVLGNLTLFMAPLCAVLLIDVVMYSYMIIKLGVLARQTMLVRSSHNEKLRLSVKLIFAMGLTWTSAVVASFTRMEAFYCLFSLLDSLQGLFIFLIFVCKRKILATLRCYKATLSTPAGTLLTSTTQRTLTTTVSR